MCIHVYTVIHVSSLSIIDHQISRRSKKYPPSLTSEAPASQTTGPSGATSVGQHAGRIHPLEEPAASSPRPTKGLSKAPATGTLWCHQPQQLEIHHLVR